jgi:hypothetical protein
MALDLAGDRRHRERGEADLAVEVEALDGLHEAERGHLLEVVESLALIGVAARQRAGQRERALHQLTARSLVLFIAPAAKQLALVGVRRQRFPSTWRPGTDPPFPRSPGKVNRDGQVQTGP